MPQIPPYEIAETLRLRKSQYCRLLDTHDWKAWGELFLPTATATFNNPDGSIMTENNTALSFDSRHAMVSFFSKVFDALQTTHVVGAGELTRVSEDEVRAIWPATYHAASQGVAGGWTGTGGGQYHEVWKRVEGEWFIGEFRLVRSYWKVQSLGESEA
ncbi:hypothetical protein BJX76DRAFT_369614 [Aspergillus varians]